MWRGPGIEPGVGYGCPDIQWQHSYAALGKTFCVYLAKGESAIRQHADLSGIPFTSITEDSQIIDPLTANNCIVPIAPICAIIGLVAKRCGADASDCKGGQYSLTVN